MWQTVFNYIVPMAFTIILNTVLLPRYGGEYNQAYLTAAATVTVIVSLVGVLLVCVGVSAYDKPENFRGTNKANERLKWKDMWGVLRDNKPLQAYIISASSDKIAQQAGAAAVVSTMLSGILIGNMTIKPNAMKTRINNCETEIASGTTIAMIAQAEGLPDRGVAIAVNGEIVQRTEWNERIVSNGDDIIILKAFCGG